MDLVRTGCQFVVMGVVIMGLVWNLQENIRSGSKREQRWEIFVTLISTLWIVAMLYGAGTFSTSVR